MFLPPPVKAVIGHPGLLPPSLLNGNVPPMGGRKKQAMLEAVDQVRPSIVRDYLAEILVLLVGVEKLCWWVEGILLACGVDDGD